MNSREKVLIRPLDKDLVLNAAQLAVILVLTTINFQVATDYRKTKPSLLTRLSTLDHVDSNPIFLTELTLSVSVHQFKVS